ncbi:MAG TPA: phage capsid protein [Chitinophagaceae bacterium]|nr:phage capsid protein [Chitinophagaceae bacterium]
MKRLPQLLFALAGLLLMMVIPTTVVAHAFTENPTLTILVGAGITYLAYKMPKLHLPGVTMNGVQTEIWTDWIADNLFKGVEFLKNCFRADEYVLQGKVVHIPQAGGAPAVVKNRTSLPATAAKRTDTDVTYPLDEYSTDPTVITDAEKVEVNYDKITSVLGDHMGALNETACDNILIGWCPVANARLLRTTGATSYAAHLTAATGTRKGLSLADIKAAKIKLDKDKVPAADRYCLMSSDMWGQLEDELKVTTTRDYSLLNDPVNGVIAKLYGFNIIVTVSMPIFSNAVIPAVKAYGAAGAATDNEAVLCWQKSALELALGEIKFFEKINDPQYYGDVYSALVRMGGRVRRNDEKGVVAIIQVP